MSGRPRSLTNDDIALIREMKMEGAELRRKADKLSNKEIAKKFDVCKQTIVRITSYPYQA